MLEQVQQRVRAHDRYQVEFKLDYELLPRQQTRYKITTYIFIPHSLNINSNTYTKAEFYRDLQNYVRLKTPSFTLQDLLALPTSPLVRIGEILCDPDWSDEPANREHLVNSFKFLRAMLKSSLRNHLYLIQSQGRGAVESAERTQRICLLVNELLDRTSTIVMRYRHYSHELAQANVAQRVWHSYRLTDESISLVVEESLVDAFQLLDSLLPMPDRADLQAKISQQVQAEIFHRQNSQYNSLLQPAGDNQAFLFRASVLKKFTSSVLYLALVVKPEGTAIEQLLYAVAAGLAMTFATIIAFYFQSRFGTFTFPVFVALVVGYMFKDRIKELAKLFFAQHLQSFLYNRRTLVKTLDGAYQLGFLREKVTLMTESAMPPAVVAVRNRGLFTEVDNDGQAEHVICYTKEVVLDTEAFNHIDTGGPPITGVNDIMRFDVRPYLRKMDDPVERRPYLQNGELRIAECAKIYYVNFVTVYTTAEAQTAVTVERTLLTLTRDGIQQVEQVSSQDG